MSISGKSSEMKEVIRSTRKLRQRWRRIFLRADDPAIANKIEQRIHQEKATRFERVDDCWIGGRRFAQKKIRISRGQPTVDLGNYSSGHGAPVLSVRFCGAIHIQKGLEK
jgi:hypothetical protein